MLRINNILEQNSKNNSVYREEQEGYLQTSISET